MAGLTKKGMDSKSIKKQDKSSEKKPRRSPVRVVKDTIGEMKKVTWPSRREWFTHATVVTVFVVIMMVIVGLIDTGLSALFGLLIA